MTILSIMLRSWRLNAPYVVQSAKHSWTFNLRESDGRGGTGRRLLNLSKTAVVERAMLELCRVCYSALH